jgi:hypothetical protein
MEKSKTSLFILVAGPYRSGTGDDPVKIEHNLREMTRTALAVFRRGHLPVLGESLALPLLQEAGSKQTGDGIFDEIFHPISRRLVTRVDAVLRIGGSSRGADEMVALAAGAGKIIFKSLDELPEVSHE